MYVITLRKPHAEQKQMKITLSQLKQIIKEEIQRSLNEVDEEQAAERKPVPDQAVKYVVDNYYDKTDGKGKWWKMSMEDAVEELLTSYGYKTPGKKHVDFTDLDQVKAVLRKDNRYKTTGGATSESTRSLRRLLRDYI